MSVKSTKIQRMTLDQLKHEAQQDQIIKDNMLKKMSEQEKTLYKLFKD